MLSSLDLKYNFLFFKFLTILNIFPVAFDRGTGKMRLKHGLASKFMFKLWQLFMFSHAVQVTMKTGHSIVFEGFNLVEAPLMMIASSAFLLVTNAGSFIFFQFRPDIVVRLFNEFHELQVISYLDYDVPAGEKSKD